MKLNLIILAGILILFSCDRVDKLNERPITVEAFYMQYACGDWNDDMKVQGVSDSTYSFLVGKDIDPEFLNGENEISGWLYNNRTEEFGMAYQMKGYISKCAESGCDNSTPKFWITEIQKLNGNKFETSGEN